MIFGKNEKTQELFGEISLPWDSLVDADLAPPIGPNEWLVNENE